MPGSILRPVREERLPVLVDDVVDYIVGNLGQRRSLDHLVDVLEAVDDVVDGAGGEVRGEQDLVLSIMGANLSEFW